MPFDPSSTDYLPPRRHSRSLDLDDSARKAAAWVWYLHDEKPGITTEGRFLSHHSRRKSSSSSSSSYDRKSTRFQREAAAAAKLTASEPNPKKAPVWDCGSKLYDTFELVSFSNRLDRSLLGTPALHARRHQHYANSALQESAGVLRTTSLPRSFPGQMNTENGLTANVASVGLSPSTSGISTQSSNVNSAQKVANKWASMGKAWKMIKEKIFISKPINLLGCKPALTSIYHNNNFLGCKPALASIYPNSKPLEPIIKIKAGELDRYMRSKGDVPQEARRDVTAVSTVKQQIGEPKLNHRKHLHHHVHHHHHHYVHHNLASESARLSSETVSKLCAENNWYL